jgi:hypothetical protein
MPLPFLALAGIGKSVGSFAANAVTKAANKLAAGGGGGAGLSRILGLGAGLSGAANTAASLGASRQMMREADSINPVFDVKRSEEAGEMKGFAQMRLNARNPMAEFNRRSVQGSQANAMATAQRNVIDPGQLLAFAAAAQGQTDQALGNAAQQDLAFQQANVGNFMNALNVGVNQDNLENQFMAQKFQIDQGRQDALRSAARQTTSNALSNLGTTALGVSRIAGLGGFGKK